MGALAATVAGTLMACSGGAADGSVDDPPQAEIGGLSPHAGDPPPGTTLPPGPPFNRGAAAVALAAVNVQACKKPGGPTGLGHVTVTFVNNGSVSSAVVDPPYAGTTVGACVATKYRAVHVPAFGGASVTIGKTFLIE